MKMKKILSLILAISLVLSLGVGCKPNDTVKPQNEGQENSNEVKVDETFDTDVLVIGGGGAGLTSALTASENGKKVILIEKVGYLGGATLMSGGIVPASGTKQQEEAGIVDNVDLFARDIFRPSSYSVRKDLVYTVAENAKDVVEWLESLGVKMTLITDYLYYGQSNYRMHIADGKGKGMTEKIIETVENDENITVMLNTPGTGLIEKDGEVLGAYAKTSDGKVIRINAENTILATSGYGANPEMIEKYIPEMKNAFKLVAPGATGDGILWGMDLGANTANMKSYQGHGVYSEEFGGSMDLFILYRGGILVNTLGDRFTNEHMGYSELSPHVLAQPTSHVYMVFNKENADKTAKFNEYMEKGIVVSAETPKELASKLQVDEKTLLNTFDEYKKGIEKGEDRFNRTNLPTNFNGPYYAIKITSDLRHTQGGLVTDVVGHVLREDGSLIKGLYAAGGVMEGFSDTAGPGYMSGNGLLQAFVFGRAAGKAAATETRESSKVVLWEDKTEISNDIDNSDKEDKEDTKTLTYKDGKYEGEGKGHASTIKVLVTVDKGKVSNVEILEQNDTKEIFGSAVEHIISGIIENNGSSNVDTVTGATNSSKGIISAVNNALEKAK